MTRAVTVAVLMDAWLPDIGRFADRAYVYFSHAFGPNGCVLHMAIAASKTTSSPKSRHKSAMKTSDAHHQCMPPAIEKRELEQAQRPDPQHRVETL